jgi:hypothetical protein
MSYDRLFFELVEADHYRSHTGTISLRFHHNYVDCVGQMAWILT